MDLMSQNQQAPTQHLTGADLTDTQRKEHIDTQMYTFTELEIQRHVYIDTY